MSLLQVDNQTGQGACSSTPSWQVVVQIHSELQPALCLLYLAVPHAVVAGMQGPWEGTGHAGPLTFHLHFFRTVVWHMQNAQGNFRSTNGGVLGIVT